ncbi:MAG: ABC transporter ATP-binding protein/permease [Spirochaetales bacterium]|nr:ABC transporter ATP-binding protein/permease [Spirochaetales bacterium]
MKEQGNVELLWRYSTGFRRHYGVAVIAMAISTALSYAVPLIVRFTIDSVLGGGPVDMPPAAVRVLESFVTVEQLHAELWIVAAAIVAATLVAGVFQYVQQKRSALAAEGIARHMRERLYDHLQHLSYAYHVKAATGDLIQRCTSDVDTVRRFLAIQIVEVARALILLATAYPLLWHLHVGLTLISAPLVVVIFLHALVFYGRVQNAFKESDEAEGRFSTVLQENLTGVRVVRAFGRQRFEEEKFERKNRDYRDITMRMVHILARYWGSSDLLAMSQMCLVLFAGTWLALSGAISIGDLVVFISVDMMILWPVRQLGRILADMGKATVAAGRIDEILSEETEYPTEQGQRPPIEGRVEFRNVRFSYDDGREVLKGISFTAERGMTVAILGPTGSGKSSLMQLLSRLYDYTSGSILVDGVPLKDIDKKWIRRHVAFVLQEPFLYAKTVRENIGLARRTSRDAEIFEAARDAAVHTVIEGFERGYDTLVGERGVTLSGGQKQRVAIARALVTDNPILVFDDSLSAVDTETDIAIRKALARRTRHATTFIISHRVTTLASADLILVMDEGRIVQRGTHETLIATDGLYRTVWNIQNSLSDEMEKELDHEHI